MTTALPPGATPSTVVAGGWGEDEGTRQRAHHTLAGLPRGEDGEAPVYLDHTKVASARAAADLLAALGLPPDEQTPAHTARVVAAARAVLDR